MEPPDGEPEAALVRRARDGDPQALNALVSRHHEVAYRVALSVTGDPEMAADAAQDGFLRAFQALASFRGEARFRTWLLSIVMNEARGQFRKRKRRREAALEEAPALVDGALRPDEAVAVRAEARRARTLLAELPEKQRLAVQLRLDEGLSFREVGELIDCSEGSARVNYHHGIRRLRERMETHDYDV